jgi:1,2-diacylglycerol 3-beta-galactosyltransferase
VPTIEVWFYDAGGGHRSTAVALAQHLPWDVRLVNLNDVLRAADPLRRVARSGLQDAYNGILRHALTRLVAPLAPGLHWLARVLSERICECVAPHLRAARPDMVISVVPHFNGPLQAAVRRTLPGCRFVVLMTDLGDAPPHFWLEPQTEFVICPTDRAVEEAIALGVAKDRVYQTNGILLRREYYSPRPLDTAEFRQSLGLDGHRPVGLVQFGAMGSRRMLEVAKRLLAAPGPSAYIFIAGKAEGVRCRLEPYSATGRAAVCGFSPDFARYLAASDFVLGKPGGVTVSEAAAMRVPQLVEYNGVTMPQERRNAEWVRATGVGGVVADWAKVASIVAEARFDEYRRNLDRYRNTASDDVPSILEEILGR